MAWRIVLAATCAAAAILAVSAAACGRDAGGGESRGAAGAQLRPGAGSGPDMRRSPPVSLAADSDAAIATPAPAAASPSFGARIAAAARAQIGVTLVYDPAYVRLPYPGGDVPADRGVCSDVVVRALRAVGIDLQRELHEDMRAQFALYPRRWGLTAPDRNIDHRRVPNLATWFTRQGWALPASDDPAAYADGDIVAWDLGRGLAHVGVVSVDAGRPLIVHNIGQGARCEDVLSAWPRTGRYRPRDR